MSGVKEFMLNAGLREINYGVHAIAFMNKTGEIVKVFEYDPCYQQFVLMVKKNESNPHFPNIRKIASFRRRDLAGAFMVKMEPLTPLSVGEWRGNIGLHCYMFIEHTLFGVDVGATYDMPNAVKGDLGGDPTRDSTAYNRAKIFASEWQDANPLFAKAINLSVFGKGRNCNLDLHGGNFMKRGDTWVITDPYIE